jgi:predicted nucleic acid-binding protein
LTTFQNRLLPINTAVARCAAALHVPDRQPERDALIAATAIIHRMTVVTRNVADFTSTGVAIVDPWQSG